MSCRWIQPRHLTAMNNQMAHVDNILNRWIKDSIPSWQKILQESIEKDDTRRKDYAEWMLKDVLKYRG